ncbi:MAG TPA: uroporphyrinogen-III synthase [Bacillaceae bacterium]
MTADSKPLKGKHILITRGGEQGVQFCSWVANAGGVPHMVQLIDFRPHEDPNAQMYMKSIKEYEWIIFTSKNGVNYFFQHMREHMNEFARVLPDIRFAAVGEKTRAELEKRNVQSHFMPNIYTAEDFAREFFEKGLTGERVLIPKGNLAGKTIAESFRSRNLRADEWIVYDTFYPSEDEGMLITLLQEDRLDMAVFASPSAFQHYQSVVDRNGLLGHSQKLYYASIGTVTKKKMEKAGYQVDVCPDTFTMDEMFAEIRRFYDGRQQ